VTGGRQPKKASSLGCVYHPLSTFPFGLYKKSAEKALILKALVAVIADEVPNTVGGAAPKGDQVSTSRACTPGAMLYDGWESA